MTGVECMTSPMTLQLASSGLVAAEEQRWLPVVLLPPTNHVTRRVLHWLAVSPLQGPELKSERSAASSKPVTKDEGVPERAIPRLLPIASTLASAVGTFGRM